MDEEYLILQCPACERSVKIKSDAAGTRLGCPYCKEPIEVGESGSDDRSGQSWLEEEEEEEERPPLVFRKMDEAAGSQAPPPVADTTHESATPGEGANRPEPAQGERRKHRKRHVETLGWDEEKGAHAESDEFDDDSSQFLEMDPDSPGGVRLKRVRRKKLLTTKGKFLRYLTAAVFAAAAVLAGLIIYSAIIRTGKVLGTEADTFRKLPAEIAALIEEARETPITADLTRAEEEIAVSVLSGFLNAKSTDERLQYIRDQERVKPLMEAWYAKNPEEATKEWPDAEILLRKKIIDQGRFFIVLAVEFVGVGQRVMAIEQKPDGEMRLDWETTIGYQPMPIEEFKAAKPTEPVKFWVKIKPSEFYNFEFADSAKFQAVDLTYPGRIEFKLTGYIDRGREWAPILIEQLENGASPSLIVELKYPDGDAKDDSLVEIVSVLSETWWQ